MSTSHEAGAIAVTPPAADLDWLLAFVTVARLGTVGRAAEALGRTQPSISARLAELESAWETRLFRREARGMSLTPEGARLLPHVEAVLRSLEELDRLAGLPIAPGREVRVGAGDALGRELLPTALAELLREEASASVRIVEGPGPRLVQALRRGEIDVALVVAAVAAAEGDDLEREGLIDSPVDLLFRRELEGVRLLSVSLDALRDRRIVTLQPGSAFREHLEAAFASRGMRFAPAVEVGNLSLVRRFVAAGLGVAPVPAVAFRRHGGRPGVDRCRLRGVEPVRYDRVVRRRVPLPEPSRRLLELLAGRAPDRTTS